MPDDPDTFRWDVPLTPGSDSIHWSIKEEMHRRVMEAFAAGFDYVSLQADGVETGRMYRDGRNWKPGDP